MLLGCARLPLQWLLGALLCVALPLAAEEPAVVTTPAVSLALSAEETEWLAENPVVRVLSDAASPPFDFLDAEGRHTGLFPDYLAELSQHTGLRFERDQQTRRQRLADAAKGGQRQLVIAFALPLSAERGFVPIRRVIAHDYPVLVMRRDGGGFEAPVAENQRVSEVRAYAPAQEYAERMRARQYLNSEVFETALVDVAVGRTDLSVQPLAVAEFLIRQRGLAGLRIAGPYSQSASPQGGDAAALYWWVPTAAAPLAGILEKAWDSLPAERHRALRARWLDPPKLANVTAPPLPAAAQAGKTLTWLALGMVTAVALLLAVLLWRQRRRNILSDAQWQRAQRLSDVLDHSPGLLFEMEQNGNGNVVVRYASPEARQMFAIDIDGESLPLEAFLRTIATEDQPAVLAAIQHSAAHRVESEHVYRVLSPTGLRWVKTILRPHVRERGKLRWSGITVDIGAQKQAELRAEEAQHQLQEITNKLPGVVYQIQRDLAGDYQLNFASAAISNVRGVRIEDFNRDGDAFFNSVHEEDRDRLRTLLDHSAMTLEPLATEYRVRMADGSIEWLSTTAHPIRRHDGVVVWNGYTSNVSRLKASEVELGKAQRFLHELTDGVPGCIYQMRRDSAELPYRFSFVSVGVSSHGVTVDQAMADLGSAFQAIYPEDLVRLREAIERSYGGLSPLRMDYRLHLPSGLTAWMRTQAMPSRLADGAVLWNGLTINISEEKLRELQARRAEERLTRIANTLPGVVFQAVNLPSGERIYPYISDAVRTVWQLEPDAVQRNPELLYSMVLSEDRRRTTAAYAESAETRHESVMEYRIRRTDGALRWLRTMMRPQGMDGETFIWNGFTQDITDQKESEAAALALQQRLREVTENVPCTVFQLQRDFEDELSVRFVSENLYALIGISREEVMADIKVLINRITADDLAHMLEALDTAHTEQRPVFFDIRIRDTADVQRWVRGSVSTPRVEDGGLVWSGAWLDITDIKTLESELASASRVADVANRMKSEFLATMSHEIRTPMNAIIGLGQLLQQTPLNSHQRSYLDKINTASQSLLGILNDILDLSKIEAGKMSVERIEFDLNGVLDNLCALTHFRAAEKGLELRFEVPPGMPMRLLGDPLRLGQVLLNLTSNAIKFSEDGQVVVRVREVSREGSELRLAFEVADEGIGLSVEQIERLFDSFSQGDASTTRKYGGTGLGLSISRNLVRLMGGDISVQSVPGGGSTFRFEASVGLPLELQPRYDLPRDLYGLRALVVDDNPATRCAIAGWLAAFGFQVVEADSGEMALRLIQPQKEPFALVLLDWRMPDINGAEVAERIRALPLVTQPAVMMTSAFINEAMVQRLEKTGIRDFLAKPFSPALLFKCVLAAMGRLEMGRTSMAESRQALSGLRVLIADDNEINLEITQQILESAGATLRLARDGEEALNWLEGTEFDVALLDLQMPKLDGLEVARHLRKLPRHATLPLVAMTAHALPEYREATRAAGFDAHLLKPIDRHELVETLLQYRQLHAVMSMPATIIIGNTVSAPAVGTVPAFDRAAALLRLGGNTPLLENLLLRFAADHTDAAQVILNSLETGDRARATREAHTLKGVAANLGANLLAGTASAVEAALRQGEALDAALLGQLRIHHQETLRAMQPRPQATSVAPPAEPPAAAALLVARLQALLAQHDADAKDAFEALTHSLSGVHPTALLRLRAAVENYEFDEALVALRDVLRNLNLE